MKHRYLVPILLLLTTLPVGAAPLRDSDSAYLTSAMQTQLGRYALASAAAKNGSGQVKVFAKSVAAQASAATHTLDAIAKRYGIAEPKDPSVRDLYHYSQLNGLRGTALDSEFVQDLKIDDEMGSSRDQTESASASDPALRAYAKSRSAGLQKELAQLASLH